jgi:hypothetical protein
MSFPGEIRNDAVIKSSDEQCFKMGQLLPPKTRVEGRLASKTKARRPPTDLGKHFNFFSLQRGQACWNSSLGVSESGAVRRHTHN